MANNQDKEMSKASDILAALNPMVTMIVTY